MTSNELAKPSPLGNRGWWLQTRIGVVIVILKIMTKNANFISGNARIPRNEAGLHLNVRQFISHGSDEEIFLQSVIVFKGER